MEPRYKNVRLCTGGLWMSDELVNLLLEAANDK